MHIAYLTPEYPHKRVQHSAGIGTSIKNLATALVAQGHEVTLFIYGQLETAVFKEAGMTFHLLKQRSYKIGGFYLYRKSLQRYINTASQGIDILEAPDWTGITAFCNFNMPLVIRLNGSDTYFCHLEGRTQKRKNFLFEKWALLGATAITGVSAFTAQKTTQLFSLNQAIPIIHNMIDLEQFIPVHEPQKSTLLLNFGTLVRKKGVIALAKAFEQLAKTHKDVALLYLGKDVRDAQTGVMTSDLIKQELSDATLARVRFVNQVPYGQVQRYVKEATLVCLPSYAEAFPMTWLEAMALEKPLITSNIGWAHELMVPDKTGLTVHPDDTVAFVAALKRLLDDNVFARACGKNARLHLLEHFSKQQLVAKNISFYKNVAHG